MRCWETLALGVAESLPPVCPPCPARAVHLGLTAAGSIHSGRCIREPHASHGHRVDPALLEWKGPEGQGPAQRPAQALLSVEGKGWSVDAGPHLAWTNYWWGNPRQVTPEPPSPLP